jgi:hypothetical protein
MAEQLLLKVLKICERTLGLEHTDTLDSMNSLVTIHTKQMRWDEAEELGVWSFKTRKRVLEASTYAA